MSHEGKMRRGELSKDPTNIDRIYFLEQSKPVVPIEEVIKKDAEHIVETVIKKVKKEKKDGSD